MSETTEEVREVVQWRSERMGASGVYRGVPFEVVRWRRMNADGSSQTDDERYGLREWTWNYYLYLALDALPARLHAEFDRPPEVSGLASGMRFYRPPAILSDLEWHGGITLFEKHGGADGMPVMFKAGCDYNHLWDEGSEYDVPAVARDAMRTIDGLWSAIPDLHLRCRYTGEWAAAADGFYDRHGDFWSIEGARKCASRATPAPQGATQEGEG